MYAEESDKFIDAYSEAVKQYKETFDINRRSIVSNIHAQAHYSQSYGQLSEMSQMAGYAPHNGGLTS